jgi:hypothetical protein
LGDIFRLADAPNSAKHHRLCNVAIIDAHGKDSVKQHWQIDFVVPVTPGLNPALAKKLARYPVNGRKRSLRDIAVELEAQGYRNERGKVFNLKSVMSRHRAQAIKLHIAKMALFNLESGDVPAIAVRWECVELARQP